MAGLYYYLRGAGDDSAKKTVVIRFRHNGNFERVTEAKVALKDFDAGTGMVKLRVPGAAEENKKIDFLRSRFLHVLGWIENDKLELDLATFKAKYAALEVIMAMREKDSHKNKIQLSKAAVLDDLYLEKARLEGELQLVNQKILSKLYPGGEQEARRLTNVFKVYKEATRKKKLSKATEQNYQVTSNLFERELPGLHVDELTLVMLETLRDKLVESGLENSTILEHFIRLKAALNHFKKKVDKKLDLDYLAELELAEAVNNKPIIFLRKNELEDLFLLDLAKPRERYIRDLFLLSCYTGLRHVDLLFEEDSITPEDYIELFAQKTGMRFSVPYLRRAKEIMMRLKENTYVYEPQLVGNFNTEVKLICQNLDCMLVKRRTRLTPKSPKKHLWQMMTSKVGRKTFINLCMLAGIAEETVAKWVGHKKTNMIEQHYKDHKSMSDQEREKFNEAFEDKSGG